MYKRKARILFLGSGNSSRSQMAEGYGVTLGNKWMEVKSAGIDATNIDVRTIEIMAEDGVDISTQESITVSADMIKWADLVLTLSNYAKNNCPDIPDHVRTKHWSIDNPGKATGTSDEITYAFRSTRNEIKYKVNSMINGMKMMEKTST